MGEIGVQTHEIDEMSLTTNAGIIFVFWMIKRVSPARISLVD
jgi:hypothetical protein